MASPLGAWMLLALCANGSTGAVRERLAAALGIDVGAAAGFAATLASSPHPALAAAIAIWTDASINTDAVSEWLDRVPSVVDRGAIPSQAALDLWAKEHTRSLIEKFPAHVSPLTLCLLASALATKVLWEAPFDVAPGHELGKASAWSRQLKRVLRSPGDGHFRFIATTRGAGDVAVHIARATEGLSVLSVIAGIEVPADAVLASAHELAIAYSTDQELPRRSLFDLPLGEQPLWTLSERPTLMSGREERFTAVLPAWSARNNHDLTKPEFGFSALIDGLVVAAGSPPFEFDAQQSVVAHCHRRGFEAAALTEGSFARSIFPRGQTGVVRIAELRFGHPFAVVAIGTEAPRVERGVGLVYGPWHGVPVFSGWITNPEDAEEMDEKHAREGESVDIAAAEIFRKTVRASERQRALTSIRLIGLMAVVIAAIILAFIVRAAK